MSSQEYSHIISLPVIKDLSFPPNPERMGSLMVQLGSTGISSQLQELGVAVVAFPCGWDGTLWSVLQNKRSCTVELEREIRVAFSQHVCAELGIFRLWSFWESAELWRSFPGMWCLCGGAVVISWRGTGRENTGRASCCQQDDLEEECLLEPFWAALVVVELLGLPLCSSRQKVERLVMQYLRTGSDSLLINLLLMLLRFCQGFFFLLQAAQSSSERRLFSLLKSCSNLRMEIFLWAAVVSENNTKFGSRRFSAQSQWTSISDGWKFTVKVIQLLWACQRAALGWGQESMMVRAGNEFHEISSSQSWNALCFYCFSWVQALCGHTATLWEGVFHVGANCVCFLAFLWNPGLCLSHQWYPIRARICDEGKM